MALPADSGRWNYDAFLVAPHADPHDPEAMFQRKKRAPATNLTKTPPKSSAPAAFAFPRQVIRVRN